MEPIYKFEKETLKGESLHARIKTGNTSYIKHWHSYYEIMYYKNCIGTCELNGESMPITPRCLFLLTPKDFHEIRTQDQETAVSVNLSFTEQLIDSRLLQSLQAGPIVVESVPQFLEERILQIHSAFKDGGKYRQLLMENLLNALLIDILELGKTIGAANPEVHPVVLKAITYLLMHPNREHSLTEVAKLHGISAPYFSRLFHMGTGVSFKQYEMNLRIEYAKRLLEGDQLPITDICYDSGFSTLSQFNRMFKKNVGVTPSRWRMDRRKKKDRT